MSEDLFHRGQHVWVHTEGGGVRPAVWVGDGENATFFGGPPLAYVVFEDTREPAEVPLEDVTPRED